MTSAISRRSSTDAACRRPRRRLALLWLTLVLFALLAGAEAARGAVAPEMGERARKILADPQYQRRLPGVKEGQKVDGGRSGSRHSRRNGDAAPVDGGAPAILPEVTAELGAVAEMLLYLLLAVAAVLAGFALFQRLRARPAPFKAEPAVPTGEPAPPRAERVPGLDEAERLAAEGRWDEALHALLLQAIRLVSGRLPAPLPPSSTSRELLRLVPLSEEARLAFSGMVRAVELSLFGGAAVGAEEYKENRDRFRIVSGRSA